MQKTTTFFMFVGKQHGRAEEAINFYVSLFKDSGIVNIVRYGSGVGEPEGTVQHAVFSLNGQSYMAMESSLAHNFTFTPAISIFVTCETEEEIDTLYKKLSDGGSVLMELNTYPFSAKFGWVQDKYGVSWQLNLASK
ncbi:MAG TPA: VOC family protein [Ktedonobacteraceae bacterium]|nr:VOC family protein [Ktedonobacteraceae bacterium]